MHVFVLRKPWALIAPAALVAALALALILPSLDGDGGRHARLSVDARGRERPRAGPGAGPTPRAGVPVEAVPALLAAPRPIGLPVSVAIGARPLAPSAPPDFLGLSFELRSLPVIARYATEPDHGTAPRTTASDLVTLLRSLGPGVLRFGGASADEQVAWVAAGASLPRWAGTAVTASDLTGLAALARESGWRVLLTVNLGHYDPAAAAQEAAAAHAALGPALAGIELGNEPDMYAAKGLRPRGWGPTSAGARQPPPDRARTAAYRTQAAPYRTQAAAYRAAIGVAAPGVSIVGPDASTGMPGLAWARFAARTLHPALLTDHYYPLSSCGYRPTLGELLSPNVRRAEDAMLAKQVAIARAAATPLRVDETNSVSCEGRPGVSDTLASALWALDYSAHAITAGLAGVNFHDLLTKPGAYSPLLAPSPAALAAGALHAQPEWYALLAADQLRGARPLPTSVGGAEPGALGASAFRGPDGRLRLVLVDYNQPGSRPLAVRLGIARQAHGATRVGKPGDRGASNETRVSDTPSGAGVYPRGSVLRLTGPSPGATGGIRLGGRTVTAAGDWSAPPALPAVYAHAGTLSVQLNPSSAAIVTLYPG